MINVASKTISVTDEVYQMIKNIKLPNESFGDVIRKLVEEKTAGNLLAWVKEKTLWEDMDENELQTINNEKKKKKSTFTITEVDLN